MSQQLTQHRNRSPSVEMERGSAPCLESLLATVLLCIENFKYLMAKTLYRKFTLLLHQLHCDEDPQIRKKGQVIQSKADASQPMIEKMLRRCDDIETAFEMNSSSLDGWTFGSEDSGITTHYNIEADGMISLRVEGILYDLPLYEQLCAIYEIGLYSKWVPFCSTSNLLKQISHVELLATLLMSTPFGISREVAVHAFGANCLQEKQSIVIVTKSVDEYEGSEVPLISNSLFNDRCDVKYMYAVTTLLSPTTAKFSCVLKLDVKFRVHQMILNWFIKQLAGVVLPLLRKQAQYIADHPEDLLYSERFAANSDFYIHFLLPEFRAFIQSQSWEQPCIRCLGYAGIPVRGADYSLPLYSLLEVSPESPPIPSQVYLQREASHESTSSFFSCIQGVDQQQTFYSDFKLSRPLLDDQMIEKSNTPRKISDSSQTNCCCRGKARLLFCC